jgi:hypothetical protein
MPDEPKLAEEMRKMQEEEFLPIEKKLVGWSLGLGVVLLIFFLWLSTYFQAPH